MESPPQAAASAAASRPRRELAILLLAGAVLFTANARELSLPALDDCFYARKAVEMERSGHFFTVTWADRPAFQNPPLQIWLTARSFALFGENDLAARRVGELVSVHVIPRPHAEVEKILPGGTPSAPPPAAPPPPPAGRKGPA